MEILHERGTGKNIFYCQTPPTQLRSVGKNKLNLEYREGINGTRQTKIKSMTA